MVKNCFLVGATILQIGTPETKGLEGGGLVINYLLAQETRSRRVVFEFNELVLWTAWEGLLPKTGNDAESPCAAKKEDAKEGKCRRS
jgi:hypothetical protein